MKPLHIVIIILVGFSAVLGYFFGLKATMPPQMVSQSTSSMPSVPPVKGFYKGQEVLFIHTEASDKKVAEMLTTMMNSPVIFVPTLSQVPSAALGDVFVFSNGIKGEGPMGFQKDVFSSVPGDQDYTPLGVLHIVTWQQDSVSRELKSIEEIKEAEVKQELTITRKDVVINRPMISWPEGKR